MSLRVGFVGAGKAARRNMSIVAGLTDVAVVAVCDVDEQAAREAAKGLGAVAYSRWRDMLDHERPDALFVCTPPGAHKDPSVAAFACGIAVYIEKPLARMLGDGLEIVEAWRASGAVCAVGYQWRGLDFLDQVRELVAAEQIALLASRSVGPAESGRIEKAVNSKPGERPWFLDQEASGGILFELGSHDLDLQLALAGDVKVVQAAAGSIPLAQTGLPPSGVEDVLALMLRFETGALGTIQIVWTEQRLPEFYRLDLFAPGSYLHLELDPKFAVHGVARGGVVAFRAHTHPLVRSISQFLDAVRNRSPGHVFCTPRDALSTLAVALACEEARGTNGEVPTRSLVEPKSAR